MPAPFSNFTSYGTVNGASNTGAVVSKDLQAFSKADPEPISSTIAGIAATVAAFFGAHHAAAIAKEGQTLNAATPTFLQAVQEVMSALSQGAISESDAISYLHQSQADFETAVKPIIKDNGKCIPGCEVNGSSYLTSTGTKTHCCSTGSSCNGPCCIRCGLVIPTVENLTAIIQAGGGSFTIPNTDSHGANKATPAIPIAYTRASVLTTVDREIAGVFGSFGSLSSSGSSVNITPWLLGGAVVFGLGLMFLRAK